MSEVPLYLLYICGINKKQVLHHVMGAAEPPFIADPSLEIQIGGKLKPWSDFDNARCSNCCSRTGALVLWCFVLNPNRLPPDPTLGVIKVSYG